MKKQSIVFAAGLIAVSLVLSPAFTSQLQGQYPAQDQQSTQKASPATLYYTKSCAHCHKVMDYLKSKNKTVLTKDISNPMYSKELHAYGQRGVPVLVVGSQVLVGDKNIIKYLNEHPEVLR